MSRGFAGCGWLLSSVATLTVAHPAGAEAPANPSLPAVFPVHLYSEEPHPKALYELTYEAGAPFARCKGACTFFASPASYTLSVRGPGYLQGASSFELKGPSRVVVRPKTTVERDTDLVLGLVGAGFFAAGAVMMGVGASQDESHLIILGAAIFTTGAVVAPLGFAGYLQSDPAISVQPL